MIASGCSPLYDLRHAQGLKDVREWLGMSIAQMGETLEISRGLVANWQSGYREMPTDKAMFLGKVIVNVLSVRLGRDDIGLIIRKPQPFQVRVVSWCRECGKPFDLRDPRFKRCEVCANGRNGNK